MRHALLLSAAAIIAAVAASAQAQQPEKLEPIKTVQVGQHGEFLVNGKPFIPLCSWLQGVKRYPQLRELGFNTFVGNHRNIPPADEMGDLAAKVGAYAIPHFDGKGIGHGNIIGWVQHDEPDLTRRVSDLVVTPGEGLRVNRSAPLTSVFDGDTRNSAPIDPLAGASFTVELTKAVTLSSMAVWLPANADGNAAHPAEITFLADGKAFLTAKVENKIGQQKFALGAPVNVQKLEVRITGAKEGAQVWGRISEIEGFDAAGVNVLKSTPRGVVGQEPEVTLEKYRGIKAADPGRPVWLTFSPRFMEWYERWHKVPAEEMRARYPRWAQAADVLGTDIYPIYGFNQPGRLLDNIEAVNILRAMGGHKKPVYIWIEACNGGQQQAPNMVLEPRHTRAEVWMSLIAGARGIGYFTHAWKPTFSEFNSDAAMQAELKRLNGQITRLTAEICAAPTKLKTGIAFGNGVRGHLMANDADGGLFIVAQNLDLKGQSARATINVEGLKAGTRIEVVDEGRTITAGDGAFEDDFAALAEHVYRIAR